MGKSSRLYDHNSRSVQEATLIDETEGNEVKEWIDKIKGATRPLDRENALKDLLLAVRDDKLTSAQAGKIVRDGHFAPDLKIVLEQTRWLQRNGINFNVR
jgi:hypothetical protein